MEVRGAILLLNGPVQGRIALQLAEMQAHHPCLLSQVVSLQRYAKLYKLPSVGASRADLEAQVSRHFSSQQVRRAVVQYATCALVAMV